MKPAEKLYAVAEMPQALTPEFYRETAGLLDKSAEAIAVALTMYERAQFDAHDREWARKEAVHMRAILARLRGVSVKEQPGADGGDQ